MAETRTRPAREAQRFQQIVMANLWFWYRMNHCDDAHHQLIHDWDALPNSVKIRRWRAAMPQATSDEQEAEIETDAIA